MPKIRQAKESDIARILELYRVLGDKEQLSNLKRYLPVFRRIKADKTQQLLVLEDEGKVVGTLTIVIVDSLGHAGRRWCELENLAVDATAKRKGYGRMLMAHAEKLAKRANCHKIQLMSRWTRAEEAHKFYEALGYESPARAFRKYFPKGK